MAWLFYEDWLQWKERGSIAGCDPEVRARFESFVAKNVKRAAYNPERFAVWMPDRLTEYLADHPRGRQLCAEAFDSFMTGRKGELLLNSSPEGENPTDRDRSGKWCGYAIMCVYSMLDEIIRKEVSIGKGPPESLDEPVKTDGATTRGELIESEGESVQESQMRREIRDLANTIQLTERECLILWADYHNGNRCSEQMQKLAGCGRAQLSSCARFLQSRLLQKIVELFDLKSHEHQLAAGLTVRVWEHLAEKFKNILPEKSPTGGLLWKEHAGSRTALPDALNP